MHLDQQPEDVTARLKRITKAVAPDLVAITAVGPEVASTLLVTAADNPDRLNSEAPSLPSAGATPSPPAATRPTDTASTEAGTGTPTPLLRIVFVRLGCDQRTRDYVAKRTAEGKSKAQIMRCLNRYVARHIYAALPHEALG